ncbi:hypothetical protein E2C01_021202 [Portunus trituberculatus]|uniref:Uncharacterized protein n=1 Tax=Portunus trituberculatus TaxID=210409 RepID=A0A5B7E3K8_PORTR|nr:hypothetical protein [Portunus trituberculatus]
MNNVNLILVRLREMGKWAAGESEERFDWLCRSLGKESTRIEGPVQRPEGPAGPALLLSPEDPGTKDFLKGLLSMDRTASTMKYRPAFFLSLSTSLVTCIVMSLKVPLDCLGESVRVGEVETNPLEECRQVPLYQPVHC